MSETNLNDLSKIYLDQIAEKKKDDTYLEPDMKKRQANNEKARKDLMKGPQMKNPHFEEKKLDPVGQEDADIDNDGDVDSSDKYLKKRRKAIGKAIKKESFTKSDWRDSLSEVINDIESKPIKEKKVSNKVKINPTMGEAVEEMGGTLLEEIEVDEFEGIVEEVYDELIEEGYSEDDVEVAIEQALNEATVSFGHDTKELKKDGSQVGSRRRQLKRRAGEFLQKTKKKVGMASAKAQVAAYNKSREVAQTAGDKVRRAKKAVSDAPKKAKSSVKGGIRKLAQKVVDRMSEEVIGEAVYGGTKKPEPTDKRMTVTNADKAGNTPAYQAYKAGDKRYKAADHMKEGVRDVDPEKGTAERKARLEKKRGMKMDDHPQYKKEEVEDLEETKLGDRAYARARDAGAQRRRTKEYKQGLNRSTTRKEKGMYRLATAQRRTDADLERQKTTYDTGAHKGDFDRAKRAKQYKKEEVEHVEELYKGKHGQSEKEYQDSRSDGGKMVSGDSKRSGAAYSSRAVKNTGPNPAGGSKKPQGQGRMTSGARAELQYRKANLRKEEAAMSPGEVALQKKKAMIDKMIASKRMQGLKSAKKSEAPTKAMGEGLSIDQQMKISRDHNRKSPEEKLAANKKALGTIKKVKREKDTRTDAQKMTDATGPRPGSRYRGD